MEAQQSTRNQPRSGVALFRWILEQRKRESKHPVERTATQKTALEELKKRNAERGTPIIKL